MNWVRFFILLFTFAFAGIVLSEEVSVTDPRWKQLSQAYGFVLCQQASIELIQEKYPDLARDAKEAAFAFNSTALGASRKGIEEELSNFFGEKWPEHKHELTAKLDSLIGEQKFTRPEAVEFLQSVKKRAKGEIPEVILAALLSANLKFSKNPELELLNGWKQTFRTKGHPKAKGVDFSISLPASWSKREGYRPNIIQFFQSGDGYGPATCSLVVKTMPFPPGYKPTKDEIKEFFQPNELKDMIPDGSTFVAAKTITLENSPAGMLVFDQTQKRLEFEITTRMTQFSTVHDNAMIAIQFALTPMPDSTDTLDSLQEKFLLTFNLIANSFVLNELYE
jgi:hypothetical protein